MPKKNELDDEPVNESVIEDNNRTIDDYRDTTSIKDVTDNYRDVTALTSEPTTETFVCPDCGREFSSETSLKMHRIRSHHRGSMGEPSISPPITISTDADVVRDILRALKYDKIDAYLKICDLRGYNIVSLYQAAKDIAMPFSIMKPLLSFWASYKGEPIPPPIARELGLTPATASSAPLNISFPELSPPMREASLVSEVVNALIKLRELEKNSSNNEITRSLQEKIEAQRLEIEKLKEELRKRDLETLQKEIEILKSELEEVKNSGRSDFQALLKELNERIDRLGNRAEMLFMAALGYLPAEVASQPPPEITGKVGEPKITELLPKELVEG